MSTIELETKTGVTLSVERYNELSNGLLLNRRNAGEFAKRLAEELYPLTVKPYASDESGKKWLAQSIEFHLHVILNQAGIEHLFCQNCEKDQQEHVRTGGWCPNQLEAIGTRRWAEKGQAEEPR